MRIKVFGNTKNPILLFFCGSCSHLSWYQDSIDQLTSRYYVFVPEYDGYSLEKGKDFISIEDTVKKITDLLLLHGYRSIHLAYGLSMGGGMVLKMLIQKRIFIENAVIDGGITPYQLPRTITWLIALRDYLSITIIRSSLKMMKAAIPPGRWLLPWQNKCPAYLETQQFLKSLSRKTLWNSFYSVNNYSMPKSMPHLETHIEYWYGALEKKARKRDISYVKKHFPNATLEEFPDMNHAEFVMMKPKEFYSKINQVNDNA